MPCLINERPVAQRKAAIYIENQQLRDLVHATERAGEVITVHNNAVVKYNVHNSEEPPSTLSRLSFSPTTLSYSYDPRPGASSLVAVGGPRAKVVLLSIPPTSNIPSSHPSSKPTLDDYTNPRSYYYDPELALKSRRGKGVLGPFRSVLSTFVPQNHQCIINSVAFAPLPTDTSALSSSLSGQRRLLVSSNDYSVRIYRTTNNFDGLIQVKEEAVARFNARMNHASVSPDGRTLLSAGDSPFLHLHSLASLPTFVFPSSPLQSNSRSSKSSNTSRYPRPIHVIPTSTLSGSNSKWSYSPGDKHNTAEAIFSTAFSADGWKLAAGSQDGIVQVWDVRSLKQRLAIFGTLPSLSSHRTCLEDHDGDVDPNPNHRCPCQGKTWGVRSLRFTPSSSLAGLDPYGDNRELLVFSEHQSTIHIVDARTFDTSPDSRQRLFLPDILQRYPKSSYIEQTTKTANAIQLDRRGKKRKRGELSDSDGDDAERKRRETADELVDNAEIVARPWPVVTVPYLPGLEDTPPHLRTSLPEVTVNSGVSVVPINEHDAENQVAIGQTVLDANQPVAWDQAPVENIDQWPLRVPGLFGYPPSGVGTPRTRDDTVMRQAEEVIESTGQLDRRLRRFNTQLQDLVNTSAGTSRASTSRSTNSQRLRSANGPESSHATRSLEVLRGFLARSHPDSPRPYPTPSFARRIDTYLDQGAGAGTHRRIRNLQSTRDRIEALRRERDLMASLGEDSDEDTELYTSDARNPSDDPSFSSDLVRQMMVRWRDEEGEEATAESDGRDVAQLVQSANAEDDMLWAAMGLNAVDAAEEIERWALRPDEMPMDAENVDADTMTNDVGSGDETVDVDDELDLMNHLSEPLDATPEPESLNPPRLTNEVETTVQLTRRSAPSMPDFLRLPLYQHSNRSTTNLPMASSVASPTPIRATLPSTLAVPSTSRPLFTASPEPMDASFNPWDLHPHQVIPTPPLPRGFVADPRSPPTRSLPQPRFRFAPHRPLSHHYSPVRSRPFSSRVFGVVPPPPPPMGEFRYGFGFDGSDEELEDDDRVEGKRLEIAGFTFGIPGTESEGTMVVGTVGRSGRGGGKLLEFSTIRQCGKTKDTDDNDASGSTRWTRWAGRKYARGGFV